MATQRIGCQFSGAIKQTSSTAVSASSSPKDLFIWQSLFSGRRAWNLSVNRKLWAALCLLMAVPGLSVKGAGYMISAKDRAQATALSQQAYVTFQSGDYDQALGLLTQSDQLKPDQPDGWNLRGVIYLKQKAYDKAQAAFTRAVALDPDLWAARFNLAEVFFQRRDYARARASFEGLLSQTDRFKEKNKWELVQYKALVCCVLMGDETAATRKLAQAPGSRRRDTGVFLRAGGAGLPREKFVASPEVAGGCPGGFPPSRSTTYSRIRWCRRVGKASLFRWPRSRPTCRLRRRTSTRTQ